MILTYQLCSQLTQSILYDKVILLDNVDGAYQMQFI